MLSDHEIATRLRHEFEHATADLHYTRRVTPPRPRAVLVLAPAATLVGAAAVGAVVVGQPAAAPRPPVTTRTAPPTASSSPAPSTGVATAQLHLAGYTFTVPRSAGGDPDDLGRIVLDDVVAPPAAARRLPPLPQAPEAKAWVGTYPGTGRSALWFQAPTRNGGRLAAIVANSWTPDQLANVWATGVPDPR